MPSEQHYNDTEANYFLLFVLAVILFPATFVFLKKNVLKSSKDGESVECKCTLCKSKKSPQNATKKSSFNAMTLLQVSALVLFWGIFVYVALNAGTGSKDPEPIFDPFEILGLSHGASNSQIRQAYRELSLVYHPDKVDPNDPAAANKFIDIGKAYKALTDDVARANYEKYGNPDGPQAMSVGIALFSFLVKKENTLYVLGVYMALLIVGLPAVVCCWWRSWKKYDSTKVMNNTMGLFYHKVEPLARVKVISELVSAAQEYQTITLRNSDEQNIARIQKMIPEAHSMKKKPKYNAPYALKTNALFYAQMSRLQNQLSPGLKADLEGVLKQVRTLLGGFITISTAKSLYVPIVEALLLSQQITQSTWNKEDLLQLPHITRDMYDVFSSRKKNCAELSRFISLGAEKRKALLKEEGLEDNQIEDVEKVLEYLPSNVGMKVSCKVEGEGEDKKIVARSVVTCFFKVFRGEDEDEEEDDDDDEYAGGFFSDSDEELTDAQKQKRKERKEKQKIRQQKKKEQDAEDAVKRYVHAPYFPDQREESWWIVIGEPTKYELVGVHKIGTFGKKSEGKIKFLAPQKPGAYNFVVNLMCDGYLGCDVIKTMKIQVVPEDPAVIAERKKQEKEAKADLSSSEEEEEEEYSAGDLLDNGSDDESD